jgi:hypothetical protein
VRFFFHADTRCNILWLAFERHAFCISIGTPAVLPLLSWLSWASPVLPITLTAFFPHPLQFTAQYNPNSTTRSQIYRVVQQTNNLFSKYSRPALPSTQPPVRFFSASKVSKVRNVAHPPPSSAEVKNGWSCRPTSISPSHLHEADGETVLNKLTCSLKIPSWETNTLYRKTEIPQILWNLEGGFCVYNNLPTVPILSQMNQVESLSPHICKISFDTTLQFVPNSSKYPLSSAWETDPVTTCRRLNGFGGPSEMVQKVLPRLRIRTPDPRASSDSLCWLRHFGSLMCQQLVVLQAVTHLSAIHAPRCWTAEMGRETDIAVGRIKWC